MLATRPSALRLPTLCVAGPIQRASPGGLIHKERQRRGEAVAQRCGGGAGTAVVNRSLHPGNSQL
jgi:hypothetical protein